MQTQLEFINRDILREACQLRLTGSKDLLHHFVQYNTRDFDRDTSRDDVWDAMGEISLVVSSSSYEARERFSRALLECRNDSVSAACDYLAIGDFL